MTAELWNHRTEPALKHYKRLGRLMPDNDLLPKWPKPCPANATGTASTASVGASLRSACRLDEELPPELQAVLTRLSDHSSGDHHS